jgi:hypothetical protein
MDNQTVVFLLGLPRSGTTLTTAILDVNPDVGALFEPWNVSKNHSLEPWSGFSDIVNSAKKRHQIDYSDKKILLLKETSAKNGALEWAEKSILNLKNNGIDVRVIWLLRDLNHSYLSRVKAAREWWGHEQMEVNQNTFRDYAKFAQVGFNSLKEIAKDNKTLFLSYEYLLKDLPGSLDITMKFMGTQRHEMQLEYEKHFENTKAAGDRNVQNNPKKPDYDVVTDRDLEWNKVKDELLRSLGKEEYKKYFHNASIVQRLRSVGPVNKVKFYELIGW